MQKVPWLTQPLISSCTSGWLTYFSLLLIFLQKQACPVEKDYEWIPWRETWYKIGLGDYEAQCL